MGWWIERDGGSKRRGGDNRELAPWRETCCFGHSPKFFGAKLRDPYGKFGMAPKFKSNIFLISPISDLKVDKIRCSKYV